MHTLPEPPAQHGLPKERDSVLGVILHSSLFLT